MDPGSASGSEPTGERDGISGAVDDLVVVALVEAHGALGEDVHGWYHLDRCLEPFR
jgi:hypothetical protein